MMNLIEMEARTLEHKLRVDAVDQVGWMLPAAWRSSARIRIGAAVDAFFVKQKLAATGRLGWQRRREFCHTLGTDQLN